MFTFNGVGTTLYGSKNKDSEGWYTATKFFCVLFFPIVPLDTYRVKKVLGTGFFSNKTSEYEMYPIEADTRQVLLVYLAFYLPAFVLFVWYKSRHR